MLITPFAERSIFLEFVNLVKLVTSVRVSRRGIPEHRLARTAWWCISPLGSPGNAPVRSKYVHWTLSRHVQEAPVYPSNVRRFANTHPEQFSHKTSSDSELVQTTPGHTILDVDPSWNSHTNRKRKFLEEIQPRVVTRAIWNVHWISWTRNNFIAIQKQYEQQSRPVWSSPYERPSDKSLFDTLIYFLSPRRTVRPAIHPIPPAAVSSGQSLLARVVRWRILR